MNMLDYMISMSSAPTKEEFGEIMHGNNEREKQTTLELVELLGGYDNLED